MMLAASNDAIGSCPNGIADGDRLRAALGHGEDEQVATVLTFGYPAKPRRDPQSLSADEWIERADRRPWEEIVEEVLARLAACASRAASAATPLSIRQTARRSRSSRRRPPTRSIASASCRQIARLVRGGTVVRSSSP